ncbi:MAG TPA: hypothetical protein VEL28_04965 [Candidatus Binatia bacterium]|nr:hypothetical protein [Candidatus Binatia bacterium]
MNFYEAKLRVAWGPGSGQVRPLILWAVGALVATASLVAALMPAMACAKSVSPLIPLLSKPGEIGGFEPGKPQVFRAVIAVRNASGSRPTAAELRRYEREGFVEAAIVRLHGKAESAAMGVSSVFEFESPLDARAEMKAKLKEDFDPAALRKEGILDYFTLRHFNVPGVAGAVAYALVSNKAAEKVGSEAGVAKGLFVVGNCLIAVGVAKFKSSDVFEPVITGAQAIFDRSGGICP